MLSSEKLSTQVIDLTSKKLNELIQIIESLLNEIMALFCDASCLIKFTRKQGAHIVKYFPCNYDFNGQEEFITSCAFPELSEQADSIFISSISRANCFTWSFVFNHEQYSIVLISHHYLGDTFLRFLEDSRKSLNGKDPFEIFSQVWNYLTSWTFNHKTSILTVITPAFEFESFPSESPTDFDYLLKNKQKGIFEVKLDNSVIVYSAFDPTIYLGLDSEYIDLLKIWHVLMTNKLILIVHDDPSKLSNAVFSVISLTAPFMYCEEYLSFTRLGDPRFAEIINGSTRWKIVGTTNILAVERCTQFSLIINLSKKNGRLSSHQSLNSISIPIRSHHHSQSSSLSSIFSRSFSTPAKDERGAIKRLSVKLMQKLEDVFNDILLLNPYSDFLQVSISRDDVSPYFHRHTSVFDDDSVPSSKMISKAAGESNNEGSESETGSDEDEEDGDVNSGNENDGDVRQPRKKKVQKQLSIGEVIEFAATQTFRTWRANIACRSAFRDALLSKLPEVVIGAFSQKQLRAVMNVIPAILDKYQRDEHMCAVLKRHMKLAKRRLKLLKKDVAKK